MRSSTWKVMGILNATPDSFFDGGVCGTDFSAAIDRAAMMIHDGASILDIGGESTRPGAHSVSLQEELDRVIPLIEAITSRFDITVSVDTTKSEVARIAMKSGAHWVNDISAGRFDLQMAEVCASTNAKVVLMHSRKTPATMQNQPLYENVVSAVRSELLESVNLFVLAGVSKESIVLDPGIGFAKTTNDNLLLLKSCDSLLSTGFPLLIGTSRKSVVGAVTGKEPSGRLAGSLATIAETYRQGARYFRVHDVAETVDLLKMIDAIYGGIDD